MKNDENPEHCTACAAPDEDNSTYLGNALRATCLFQQENPRNLREAEVGGRVCTKCGVHKAADNFVLRKDTLRDGRKALFSNCQECVARLALAYTTQNKARLKAQGAAYREKHKERYAAYDRSPERSLRRISPTRRETCTGCGLVGGSDEFFSSPAWRSRCRACRTDAGAKSTAATKKRNFEAKRSARESATYTCATCGKTGEMPEFSSSKKIRSDCKACRWSARTLAISESHRERVLNTPRPSTKTCAGCKVEKVPEAFLRLGEGLRSRCKACETAGRARKRRELTPEDRRANDVARTDSNRKKAAAARPAKEAAEVERRAALRSRPERPCTSCGVVRPRDFFTPNSRSLDGMSAHCKPCVAQRASERRARDPVGYLKRMKERNQEKRAAGGLNVAVAKRAKRVSLARRAPWADEAAIKALYAEAASLRKSTGTKWAIDHVYPLQNDEVCGLHVEANLRVVPFRLNAKKLNKLPGYLSHELWNPTASNVFHEETE